MTIVTKKAYNRYIEHIEKVVILVKKTVAISALVLTLGLSGLSPSTTSVFSPVSVEAAQKMYSVKKPVELKAGRHSKHKTIMSIPKGKTVSYVKAYGSWTQVKYGSKVGYVPTRDLNTLVSKPAISKTSVQTSYVTNRTVDVKTGRKSTYKTVVRIPKGKTVTFMKDYGSWTQIKYGSKSGYVATKTLVKKSTSTTNGTPTKSKVFYVTMDVSIKAGRHSAHKTLKVVPKGKQVTELKNYGSWTQVKYGSTVGYVATKTLSTTAPKVTAPSNPSPSKPIIKPVEGGLRPAPTIYSTLTKLDSPWSHQSTMFKVENRSYGKVLSYFNKDLRISVIDVEFSSDTKQFASAFYSVKDWMRPKSLAHYDDGIKNALLATDATADAIFGKDTDESKAYVALLKKEFDLQVAALKKNEEINADYKEYKKSFDTKIGNTPIFVQIKNETLRVYFD